jgi:hypothetical protein
MKKLTAISWFMKEREESITNYLMDGLLKIQRYDIYIIIEKHKSSVWLDMLSNK